MSGFSKIIKKDIYNAHILMVIPGVSQLKLMKTTLGSFVVNVHLEI